MKLSVKEIALFGVLGGMMYASKKAMEFLPNIHLLAVFIIAITVVYRKKALYPIYIYVLLEGLLGGFATWWIPYTYVWTILWGATMILPKKINARIKPFVYMALAAAHGLLFGIMYSPVQALIFGLDFRGMISWIVAGLPFDIVHGVSNFFCGILICPLISILGKTFASSNK